PRTSTPTCSGRCEAAAATSAWSPRSSSASTPSGLPSGRAHPLGRDRRREGPPLLPRLRPRRSRRARHRREFGAAPPLPVIPEDLHWRPVVMVGTCYAGPIEDGEQVLRPLRASRTPLLDLVGPAPYVGFQSALDSTVVHGWNYYWKSTHLPELRDDLIDVI